MSSNERLVYNLVLEGNTVIGIANELGMSARDVKVYMRNIFDMYGVDNVKELLFVEIRRLRQCLYKAQKGV